MAPAAELQLLIARAFLVPADERFARAFVRDLPGDLEDLAAQLPFDCAEPVRGFAASVRELEPAELLQAYSALFLQPPRRASLEASVHLDGAAMGPTTLAVEQRYARHGLQPVDHGMRELPDHLSRLLEFSAYLLARAGAVDDPVESGALAAEAREFLGAFVRPWIPALAVEIRAACEELGLNPAYRHLAELAAIVAWEGDARQALELAPAQDEAPQARCARCDAPYAEAAALRAVRRIMQRRRLSVAHLDLCENCRGLTEQAPGTLEPAGMRMA